MRSTLARVLLVVVIAALVGAAAYALSERQDVQYEASTRVQFGSLLSPEVGILGGGFGAGDVDEEVRIATEAVGVNSFDVAQRAAQDVPELGLNAGQIASAVTAEATRGTLIVLVRATASTPQQADRLASAYTEAYLARRRERERRRAAIAEQALQRRLSALSSDDRKGVIGASIRNQIGAVGVLKRVGSGTAQEIEGAHGAASPAEAKTRRNVLFGLLFGLAVGIGLVALRSESRARRAAGADRGAVLHDWGDSAPRR